MVVRVDVRQDCSVGIAKRTRNDTSFILNRNLAFFLFILIITYRGKESGYHAVPFLIVYMAACLAVPFFYSREHRESFNVLRHIVVPLVPFIVLIFPILAQFIPAPAAPLNLAGPIVAAWFVIGLIIVVVLSLRSPEALASSHKIYIEDEGSPQPAS